MKFLSAYCSTSPARFIYLQERTDLEVFWLEGDGVGAEPPTAEHNYLTKAAQEIMDNLKDKLAAVGIDLTIAKRSLSTEERLKLNTPGAVKDYHDEISQEILDSDGWAIKFPGRTLKDAQILQYLPTEDYPRLNKDDIREIITNDKGFTGDLFAKYAIDPPSPDQGHIISLIWNKFPEYSAEECVQVYKGWRKSPNAYLRTGLGLKSIYRPLEPVPGGYEKPNGISIDVFEPEGTDWRDGENFAQLEDGTFVRSIDKNRMDTYVRELLKEAKATGKPIMLASKDTISDLDADFTNRITQAAKGEGIECVNQLFDSFLEMAARGQCDEHIIACMPANAKMLEKIQDIKATEIVDIDEKDLPTRHFFRFPIGSGYGEKPANRPGHLAETYTLPEAEAKASTRMAAEVAMREGTEVTVVLANGNNPMDDQVERWCVEVLKEMDCDYSVKTIAQVMYEMATNPAKGNEVCVGDNVTGDFISDYNAGNMMGGIGAKSLGIPPSVDQALDENGRVIGTLSNPAAGTAEALADLLAPEKSKLVLPANILKSIALGLESHPFFDEDKIELREKVQMIGRLLSAAVSTVTAEHVTKETHEEFVTDVIAELDALLEEAV